MVVACCTHRALSCSLLCLTAQEQLFVEQYFKAYGKITALMTYWLGLYRIGARPPAQLLPASVATRRL